LPDLGLPAPREAPKITMSVAKKLAIAGTGVLGVGYAAYFATQQQVINRHQAEVADWCV